MSDFTEVEYEGWGGRLMESIKGVATGAICFVAAFPLLWMNEGCAVRTFKSLKEGKGAVVSVKPDAVDKSQEGKLVHLSGEATTKETLADAEFGVSAPAIRLLRKVEMYQWKENKETKKKKKVGGGQTKETTYSYEQVWSDDPIDSSKFNQKFFQQKSQQHNPPMTIKSAGWSAKQVTLGAYRLSPELVGKISKSEKLPIDQAAAAKLPPNYLARLQRQEIKLHEGGYYIGSTPSTPVLGDVKVGFAVVKPQEVSVIAQQTGETFQAYQTKAGDPLNMLSAGRVSAAQMFQKAEEAATMRTWLLRLAGFLLMAFGIFMVFNPLVVLADVLPFLGDLLGLGVGLFAALIAAALSLVTISVAWIVYRPLLGIGLLVVAGGALFALKSMGGKAKAAA